MTDRLLFDTCALLPWCYQRLPDSLSAIDRPMVAAVSIQELWAGVHRPLAQKDSDVMEECRWQASLVTARAEVVPFGRYEAEIMARLRGPYIREARRDSRLFSDMMIAATGLANDLPIVTVNVDDFARLSDDLTIVALPAPH